MATGVITSGPARPGLLGVGDDACRAVSLLGSTYYGYRGDNQRTCSALVMTPVALSLFCAIRGVFIPG
eukprot:scaffold114931_cov27-Phaeocystis_antarctica.AAC.1